MTKSNGPEDRCWLTERLDYDATTGLLRWKHRPPSDFKNARSESIFKSRDKGKVCGYINGDGYRIVMINGHNYRASRLIWVMMNDQIPDGYLVDHINGVRDDDRLENLRLATRAENNRNMRLRKDNPTGIKNVTLVNGRYCVRVTCNGIIYSKCNVNWTLEEAANYAANLRDEYHGEFARHA